MANSKRFLKIISFLKNIAMYLGIFVAGIWYINQFMRPEMGSRTKLYSKVVENLIRSRSVTTESTLMIPNNFTDLWI